MTVPDVHNTAPANNNSGGSPYACTIVQLHNESDVTSRLPARLNNTQNHGLPSGAARTDFSRQKLRHSS